MTSLLFTLLVFLLPGIRFFEIFTHVDIVWLTFTFTKVIFESFSSYMPVDTFPSTAHHIYIYISSPLHHYTHTWLWRTVSTPRSEVCWRCVDTLTGHSLFKKPADVWMNKLRDEIFIIEFMRQPVGGKQDTGTQRRHFQKLDS